MGESPNDHLAFLIPGNYAVDRPGEGLEATLRLFELGERLGYGSAWVRQRHLEPGISSAAVFLAAASQRTRAIGLGTAVIQMGYENPFRLAEDLATVDVLSGGRLQVGLSGGPPPYARLLGDRFLDGDGGVDYSHARLARLKRNLASELLGEPGTVIVSAAGQLRPRLHPVAAGLTERLWYGAGSQRSAAWAGQNGFHLLSGNVVTAEDTDQFEAAQLRLIEAFRANWQGPGQPRIALGRVVVPFDGADAATWRRYSDYAESRSARTHGPQGERRTLFAPDIVGRAEAIAEALARNPVLREATELRLELPYNFEPEEYEQILTDVIRLIVPRLSDAVPTGGRSPPPTRLNETSRKAGGIRRQG
jgi:alkanesulfonate monooxygenase SsuD/methylene tetrahydromethanopterin reductase-like flavin-dependent oxidoreductase (luciferase family)